MLFRLLNKARFFFIGSFLLLFSDITLGLAIEKKHTVSAESAELMGGASKVSYDLASAGYTISLAKSGEAIRFTNLRAANKLAIRYASVDVGTISAQVNDKLVQKVNVHMSGALANSFPKALFDIEIPAKTLALRATMIR